jgi:Cu-Zn family superoxide dismutase
MYNENNNMMINRKPDLVAYITGSKDYPKIKGKAEFFYERDGVIVSTIVSGLPYDNENPFRVFAYHIHQGETCASVKDEPFANALGHYNPSNTPHPYHAGDLPPLFSNYGFAKSSVFTARFKLNEIRGKTVIIHLGTDDFTSQPAGMSGAKIACGVIERVR